MSYNEGLILIWAGALVTLGTAYVSFMERKNDLKVKPEASKAYRVTFFIAILGIVITLVTNISLLNSNEASKKVAQVQSDSAQSKGEQLHEMAGLNLQLSLAQTDSLDTLSRKQGELINEEEKVREIQADIIGNLTSDGNIPSLVISEASQDKHFYNIQFSVSNHGKTPLRGVHATVTDIYAGLYFDERFGSFRPLDTSGISLRRTVEMDEENEIGYLPNSGSEHVYYYSKIPKDGSINFGYFIKLTWENGEIWCAFDASLIDPKKGKFRFKPTLLLGPNGKKLDPKYVRFISY